MLSYSQAGTYRKWAPGNALFGPGQGSEVGWRCGGSGWGARSPGGGGTRFAAEPDVCRALTGVAKGAERDRGELLGAGSPRAVMGEGKGRAWPDV